MRSLEAASLPPRPHLKTDVTELHRDCFACGQGADGLGLTFEQDSDDSVSAEWFCDAKYQSYPGIVHGGIIATILDCAMTNCLLLKGISAVTGDMHVHYRKPVRVGGKVLVRASLTRSRSMLFMLSAEALQDGIVCATAEAKFMKSTMWSEEDRA